MMNIPPELHSETAILVFIAIISVVTIVRTIYTYKRDQVAAQSMKDMRRHLKTIADKYTEEVTDVQVAYVVEIAVEHLKLRIGADIIKIMLHNNIRDVPDMEGKVRAYVKNAFDNFCLHMKMFKYKEMPLSVFVPTIYLNDTAKQCVKLVMNSRSSHDEGIRDIDALMSYLMTKFSNMKTEVNKNIYKYCNDKDTPS